MLRLLRGAPMIDPSQTNITTFEDRIMTRQPTLFAVTFIDRQGVEQYSRVCQSIRVARNWAKWLFGQSYTTEVIVWNGAPGGDRVFTLSGTA